MACSGALWSLTGASFFSSSLSEACADVQATALLGGSVIVQVGDAPATAWLGGFVMALVGGLVIVEDALNFFFDAVRLAVDGLAVDDEAWC